MVILYIEVFNVASKIIGNLIIATSNLASRIRITTKITKIQKANQEIAKKAKMVVIEKVEKTKAKVKR